MLLKTRVITPLGAAAITALAILFTVPASEAPARDPGKVSANKCQHAAKQKIRRKYGNVRVRFQGHPNLRQVSNAETGVRGKGHVDAPRGEVRFHYDCIYNVRNGRTHGTSVRYSGGSGGGGHHGHGHGHRHDDDSDVGTIIGAAIGGVIAGAIINSLGGNAGDTTNTSNSGGWWSPEPGVRCNSYQSTCYSNGRFDARWTHRVYK